MCVGLSVGVCSRIRACVMHACVAVCADVCVFVCVGVGVNASESDIFCGFYERRRHLKWNRNTAVCGVHGLLSFSHHGR